MTEEIIERLRSLDLSDGGSHLSAIASCFYQPTFGWTRGACETLRDKLIETMEGKYGNDNNDNFDDCDCAHYRCDQHGRQVSYDVLGTTLSDLYGIWQDGAESESRSAESVSKMTNNAEIGKFDEHVRQLEHDVEMWRDRAEDMRMERDELQIERDELLAKLDELHGHSRTCPESGDGVSMSAPSVPITDQLREWVSRCAFSKDRESFTQLADEIDAKSNRICQQRDHWHQQATDMMNRADAMEHERDNLQQTIDKMTVELESARAKNRQLVIHIGHMHGGSKKWREKCEALTEERDELQAKLEEMLKTHVELPKDENDEYIHVEDVMDGYGKTIEVVELRYGRSGWMLISRDGNGYADTYAFTHHHEPTVEQVIRDLTLGKITESQAVERIEGING